jgi:hypothetical protein
MTTDPYSFSTKFIETRDDNPTVSKMQLTANHIIAPPCEFEDLASTPMSSCTPGVLSTIKRPLSHPESDYATYRLYDTQKASTPISPRLYYTQKASTPTSPRLYDAQKASTPISPRLYDTQKASPRRQPRHVFTTPRRHRRQPCHVFTTPRRHRRQSRHVFTTPRRHRRQSRQVSLVLQKHPIRGVWPEARILFS